MAVTKGKKRASRGASQVRRARAPQSGLGAPAAVLYAVLRSPEIRPGTWSVGFLLELYGLDEAPPALGGRRKP